MHTTILKEMNEALADMPLPPDAKAKAEYVTACVSALAGIANPAAFMAAVRELIFHYHAFGLMASPDFHKLFRELATLLPPETAP